MQVFENSQKNWILQTWPTSRQEYEKEPVVKFLVPEETKVNENDKIHLADIGFPKTYYKITQVIEEKPGPFKGKKSVKAKFERIIE